MAEAVLRHLAAERGIDVEVDSAGTGGWHAGESADPRTLATLRRKGIDCPGTARQVRSRDFQEFDFLVAMDDQNRRDLLSLPGARPEKVRLFAPGGIGDPYYGGPDGFDRMYHAIEAGCERLLDEIAQAQAAGN